MVGRVTGPSLDLLVRATRLDESARGGFAEAVGGAIRQASLVTPLAKFVAEALYRELLAELGDHEDRADRRRRQDRLSQAVHDRQRHENLRIFLGKLEPRVADAGEVCGVRSAECGVRSAECER